MEFNMKSFVSILGFFIAINSMTCCPYSNNSSSELSSISSRCMKYFKSAQFSNKFEGICPGMNKELDEALIKLKECTDAIDGDTQTLCSAVENHLLPCSKPIIHLFEECLPEQSKEVPKMLFEATESVFSYLCETDGEHIFELANSCVFKSDYRSKRCEFRFKMKLYQYEIQPPNKDDICELFQSMKPCIHNHLQDSCGNEITRESFMGVFDAFLAPCKTNP